LGLGGGLTGVVGVVGVVTVGVVAVGVAEEGGEASARAKAGTSPPAAKASPAIVVVIRPLNMKVN
jgi:hypothetical protein